MRFALGFVTASVLWAAGLFLYHLGVFGRQDPEPIMEIVILDAGQPDAGPPKRARGRRRARANDPASASGDDGDLQRITTAGDDLGANDPRSIDMGAEGGEQQLSGTQINQGFDAALPRIRRCLVLAAGDAPVRGQLVFGVRIRATGEVARVNLRGPAAVTTGEASECLRTAARTIRFPTFDGPDMVVHYPLTLD